eukprot:TRINITY_DN38407_c0_g1_i1.p1 TRINITY_DN38407_c0_g1~~TRINITY_DN38407_c0_g1_i1.p1  ORF type:complete len:457 (+),score=90.46 TRINITY_DN38407_c0_g1_i1:80-1450(+)
MTRQGTNGGRSRPDALFNTLITRGRRKADSGNVHGAILDFNEALKMHPSSIKALGHRGIARGDLGDYEGAVEDFTVALQVDKTNVKAYYHRGMMLMDLGRFAEATEDFESALALDSGYPQVWFARADALLERKLYEEAVTAYSEGLQRQPKNALAMAFRGMAKVELNQLDGAIKDCRAALRICPNLPEARRLLNSTLKSQRTKATWQPDEFPSYMVVPYLEVYGFHALDGQAWQPDSGVTTAAAGSVLRCSAQGQMQDGGHTWYIVECELASPSCCTQSSPCAQDLREPLKWKVQRRLIQLREHLHDPLKKDLGEDQYASFFADAPFAMKGGIMPGTSARLADWLQACANCLTARRPSPAMVAQALQFLGAPDPPLASAEEDTDSSHPEDAGQRPKSETASEVCSGSEDAFDGNAPLGMEWRPRLRVCSGGIAEQKLAKTACGAARELSLPGDGYG